MEQGVMGLSSQLQPSDSSMGGRVPAATVAWTDSDGGMENRSGALQQYISSGVIDGAVILCMISEFTISTIAC